MNCQTFSTGLSSGHFGGSRMMVMLAGTTRRVDMCQPAWSTKRMAWAAGATDCAEDVGGGSTLVAGRAGAGAALRPARGDLVLLADASLVGEPDFYRVAVERLGARDFLQAHGKAFLKSSIAPCACAWWRGRAESLR